VNEHHLRCTRTKPPQICFFCRAAIISVWRKEQPRLWSQIFLVVRTELNEREDNRRKMGESMSFRANLAPFCGREILQGGYRASCSPISKKIRAGRRPARAEGELMSPVCFSQRDRLRRRVRSDAAPKAAIAIETGSGTLVMLRLSNSTSLPPPPLLL
jgi:hypothetical protein